MKEWLGVFLIFLLLMAVHSVLKYLDERDFRKKTENSEGWWDY